MKFVDLGRAIFAQPNKKGRGIVHLEPSGLNKLPKQGREQLLDMLRIVEEQMQLPTQLFVQHGSSLTDDER